MSASHIKIGNWKGHKFYILGSCDSRLNFPSNVFAQEAFHSGHMPSIFPSFKFQLCLWQKLSYRWWLVVIMIMISRKTVLTSTSNKKLRDTYICFFFQCLQWKQQKEGENCHKFWGHWIKCMREQLFYVTKFGAPSLMACEERNGGYNRNFTIVLKEISKISSANDIARLQYVQIYAECPDIYV